MNELSAKELKVKAQIRQQLLSVLNENNGVTSEFGGINPNLQIFLGDMGIDRIHWNTEEPGDRYEPSKNEFFLDVKCSSDFSFENEWISAEGYSMDENGEWLSDENGTVLPEEKENELKSDALAQEWAGTVDNQIDFWVDSVFHEWLDWNEKTQPEE